MRKLGALDGLSMHPEEIQEGMYLRLYAEDPVDLLVLSFSNDRYAVEVLHEKSLLIERCATEYVARRVKFYGFGEIL